MRHVGSHDPMIEPVPPAMEVQILNHWTAKEVLGHLLF